MAGTLARLDSEHGNDFATCAFFAGLTKRVQI